MSPLQISNLKFEIIHLNQLFSTQGKSRKLSQIDCITQKCEKQPNDMLDCQFGIKLDDNGNNKCIISHTRSDAVQQSYCSDNYCQSCINNYSELIESFCIQCHSGFYSSFYSGQCIKCPQECLTCAIFDTKFNNNWKWNIRAFYLTFINKNNDHIFENTFGNTNQVVCLSCYPNFQLIDNICQSVCSEDCTKCDINYQINELFQNKTQGLKCNKCLSDTFNTQRSVDYNLKSQCQVCPEYCQACIPRSSDQISLLNPFFNQTSAYKKYSHICYQTVTNNNIKIKPIYFSPIKCQDYQYCDKQIQISFFVYCNSQQYNAVFDSGMYPYQKIKAFYYLMTENGMDDILSEEILEYMNQNQITELTYQLELITISRESEKCSIATYYNNITNIWRKNVFSLQQTNLWIFRSHQNEKGTLPLLMQTKAFSINNFDKIIFEEIQLLFDRFIYDYDINVAYIEIIHDYNPIILIFKNCEMIQTTWSRSTKLSIKTQKNQKLQLMSIYTPYKKNQLKKVK